MQLDASHLHGMVVHFPIALLIVSVALDFAALYKPLQDHLRSASLITLVLGTLGAVVSVATGPDRAVRSVSIGQTHELLAKVTLLVFGALTLWRLVMVWRKRPFGLRLLLPYMLLACIGVGTLAYTGYLGGEMVYENAVGVKHDGQLVVPQPDRYIHK